MGGISHHNRGRLWKIVTSKTCDTVRTDCGGHPCARRASPDRIILGSDAERTRTAEDVRDGRRHILGGNHTAMTRPVLEDEGVVSLLADLHGIGKTFVD